MGVFYSATVACDAPRCIEMLELEGMEARHVDLALGRHGWRYDHGIFGGMGGYLCPAHPRAKVKDRRRR